MNQDAIATTAAAANVEVIAISGRRGLDDFLQVPFGLYRDDPNWVPPLFFERRDALAPKHPFFAHADWQPFVAYRNGQPIGRITAQLDRLHEERYGERAGYFGLLEAPDEPRVFAALLAAAEAWLRGRGATRVVGPFNLGVNQEVGILVEGFDTPPYFMMPHSLPYYGQALEEQGYRRAQDMLAYVIDPAFEAPRVMTALVKRLESQVRLRSIRRKHIDDDLEILRDIFNDAWSQNWNFVPFTREEFRAIGREMVMIIPDDFIQIAEVDGVPDAFIVLLPNLNEVIADLRGRLLPFGWAKLLWRLKVRYPRTGRVPLMGVRRAHHHTRLGPGLAFSLMESARQAARRRGVRQVELSWILDDNMGMRNIIETVGGTVSKRYRMYDKVLT
jgi:GNAT superfamily N-acetyltransferase